jgi:succinate dehydrogenase / fumarate reductase iron-sulfur subunit
MEIKFRVFRYNPERDKKPYFDTFMVDTDPSERILDLLELVKDDYDSTLSFRRSCAHGVCGSDAMRINAKNALACKVLVKNLQSDTITVELC